MPHRAPAALEVGCVAGACHGGPGGARACARASSWSNWRSTLAARDQGAVLLVCALKYVGGESHCRCGSAWCSPRPIARQLMELLDLHLETVELADEVSAVELRAAVVGRLGERQGELFADRWPTDPHQLAVLVNRLSSRLGYEQVCPAASCGASPVPERAVRYEPVIKEQGAGSKEARRQEELRRSLLPAPCFHLVRCCFIPSRSRSK